MTSAAEALLDDAARVHDDDAVRHARYHREVVGDVDHGHALLAAQAVELEQDAILRQHVESRGRLVEHGDGRLADARHRNRHALLLSARELVRVATREARVRSELDPVECRVHRLGRALACSVRGQDVEDRLADAQRRVERSARILRHVGDDAAAQASQGALVTPAHLLAAHLDRAAAPHDSGARVPEQRERRRRLATARLADEPEDLAGSQREADVLDHRLAGAQRKGQAVDAYDRAGRRGEAHSVTLRAVFGT